MQRNFFSKEWVAKAIFFVLAAFSALAVFTIIGYLLYASIPVFRSIGFFNFVFGSEWSAKSETFGIWRMIAGTFFLTVCAVSLGGTLVLFTAVWFVFYCPKKLKKVYTRIINLLAGIPSIVYGLFGYKFLMPLLVDIFHPDNAGFGLLACTLILSVMILPTNRNLVCLHSVVLSIGFHAVRVWFFAKVPTNSSGSCLPLVQKDIVF